MKTAAFIAGVAACAISGAHGQLYTLIDLGPIPGGIDNSLAAAVNNSSQVAGFSLPGGLYHATRWSPGQPTLDLGPLAPGTDSFAYAISDTGYIAGYGTSAMGTTNAFRWSPISGSMVDLGHLPGGGSWTSAQGINNGGYVVGFSLVSSGTRAFIWDPTTAQMTDMGDLQGGSAAGVAAYDINNNGFAAGFSTITGGYSAFLWDPSTQQMTALGDLPGGPTASYANALNDLNVVVGFSDTATGAHAFLWDPVTQSMQDLGVLQGRAVSVATGVNLGGDVVGFSDNGGLNGAAFLWTAAGGMIDLNQHLDASGAGWYLPDAAGINDLGEIVGSGRTPSGATHGYLLRLVPAPSSLALAPVALGSSVLHRRRASRSACPH